MMEFAVRCFSTVRLFSEDVAKSREWYRALLGIDPVEDMEGFVSFKIHNVRFDICQADHQSPSSTGGSVGYWLVDNLDAVIEKSKALGGSVYRGPLQVKEAGRTIVQIMDPVGNIVGFEAEYAHELSH